MSDQCERCYHYLAEDEVRLCYKCRADEAAEMADQALARVAPERPRES